MLHDSGRAAAQLTKSGLAAKAAKHWLPCRRASAKAAERGRCGLLLLLAKCEGGLLLLLAKRRA